MAHHDSLILTFVGGASAPLRESQKSIMRGAAESFFFKKTECDERIPQRVTIAWFSTGKRAAVYLSGGEDIIH